MQVGFTQHKEHQVLPYCLLTSFLHLSLMYFSLLQLSTDSVDTIHKDTLFYASVDCFIRIAFQLSGVSFSLLSYCFPLLENRCRRKTVPVAINLDHIKMGNRCIVFITRLPRFFLGKSYNLFMFVLLGLLCIVEKFIKTTSNNFFLSSFASHSRNVKQYLINKVTVFYL